MIRVDSFSFSFSSRRKSHFFLLFALRISGSYQKRSFDLLYPFRSFVFPTSPANGHVQNSRKFRIYFGRRSIDRVLLDFVVSACFFLLPSAVLRPPKYPGFACFSLSSLSVLARQTRRSSRTHTKSTTSTRFVVIHFSIGLISIRRYLTEFFR